MSSNLTKVWTEEEKLASIQASLQKPQTQKKSAGTNKLTSININLTEATRLAFGLIVAQLIIRMDGRWFKFIRGNGSKSTIKKIRELGKQMNQSDETIQSFVDSIVNKTYK
jgi:hypothetical protein